MKGRQKSLVPRFFSFFLFSAVHMTWMRRTDTSLFLLFSLFSGAHDLDAADGHLGLFSGAPVATTNRLASSLAGLFLRS